MTAMSREMRIDVNDGWRVQMCMRSGDQIAMRPAEGSKPVDGDRFLVTWKCEPQLVQDSTHENETKLNSLL